MERAPPPPHLPWTEASRVRVGSGHYNVVITYEPAVAASWVRRLPLLGPSPPVNRIIGCSFLWSEFTNDSGLRFLESITFSFYSRVLMLRFASVDAAASFPEDLRRFLANPRNIFAGVGVGVVKMVMVSLYGVWPRRTIDFHLPNGTEQAHLALARRFLGWTWPLTAEWRMFAVETSVLSQLLGHFIAQQGSLPWH